MLMISFSSFWEAFLKRFLSLTGFMEDILSEPWKDRKQDPSRIVEYGKIKYAPPRALFSFLDFRRVPKYHPGLRFRFIMATRMTPISDPLKLIGIGTLLV
jgi:hypothetical protein